MALCRILARWKSVKYYTLQTRVEILFTKGRDDHRLISKPTPSQPIRIKSFTLRILNKERTSDPVQREKEHYSFLELRFLHHTTINKFNSKNFPYYHTLVYNTICQGKFVRIFLFSVSERLRLVVVVVVELAVCIVCFFTGSVLHHPP